ncbi:hypothetical protein F5X68DRAFT_257364 [Plectosphaerella plurivora]|uniref:F-box domain-containing protein n=1 Tax=Plectosphaerella plurivora TaxID=936078 RepID=A0A9P8VLJ7_9PEZI|nr:hypothetical protein F5X68DRAFT_257364 [Plectosphaerella plurivora]
MNLRAKILAHNRRRRRRKHHPFYQRKLVRSLQDKIDSQNDKMDQMQDLERRLCDSEHEAENLSAMLDEKKKEIETVKDRFTFMCDENLDLGKETDRQNAVILSQRAIIAQHLAKIASLRDKLVGRDHGRLLNLPGELMDLILSNVCPEDCFFLSQTCQTLRALTLDRWKDNLTLKHKGGEKKFSFLLAVALRLDDAWACVLCEKIHFADVRFMPGTEFYFQNRCNMSWAANHHKFTDDDDACYEKGSVWKRLEHREVQMALKYTLRGENVKAMQFLKAHDHSEPADTFMHQMSHGKMQFYFHPKVINGRYIAYAEYTLKVRDCGLINRADLVMPIWINPCSHEWHQHTNYEDMSDSDDEIFLIENRGVERAASCEDCPTDIVCISQGDRYQIRTWRYFGQYDKDIYTFSAQANMQRPRGYKKPGQHVPESIREMWEQGA